MGNSIWDTLFPYFLWAIFIFIALVLLALLIDKISMKMGWQKPNIKEMQSKGWVQGLKETLQHKDPNVRREATIALRSMAKGGAQVGEALIEALRDKERSVRWQAAVGLGYIGDARAVEPLINAVTDKSESRDVRDAAKTALIMLARTLGRRAKAALPVLTEMLSTAKNEKMRIEIALALANIGPDAKSAVPALTIALGDSSPRVRKYSARALDNIGVNDKTTRDTIKEVLKASLEYFECDVPSGDGVCSDNNCPCPEVEIPRGTGYLYIEREIVDFRRKYPSLSAARQAMEETKERIRASSDMVSGFYRLGPILVCEKGAKLRNLDLKVAAADAKYWWETGKVPLRVTPRKKK